MHLNDDPLSLYDILELTPDATPQEIRSAYLRLRSSYGKDNIAHYSVFSREETEAMLQNIENAYLVLSNPEKRRAYDQNQGFAHPDSANSYQPNDAFQSDPIASMSSSSLASLTNAMAQAPSTFNSNDSVSFDLEQVIKNEQEWSGPAIRRIREARRITLEDLSDYTRISRSYLHALEEEEYKRLPAQVYVRGFLQQISKRLKLPTDLVSRQYLDRMKAGSPDKF